LSEPGPGDPPRGVRIELVRDEEEQAVSPLVYRGFADVGRRLDVVVSVDLASARARVDAGAEPVDAGLIAQLEKTISALVRAATRAELEEGRSPPRKIARWRSL
jgi:hypothetical protein